MKSFLITSIIALGLMSSNAVRADDRAEADKPKRDLSSERIENNGSTSESRDDDEPIMRRPPHHQGNLENRS